MDNECQYIPKWERLMEERKEPDDYIFSWNFVKQIPEMTVGAAKCIWEQYVFFAKTFNDMIDGDYTPVPVGSIGMTLLMGKQAKGAAKQALGCGPKYDI